MQSDIHPGISLKKKCNLPVRNIFAAYDTSSAGLQAMEFIERSALKYEIRSFLRNFDFLADPERFQEVLTEASEADLILICALSSEDLPHSIRQLIKFRSASANDGEVTLMKLGTGGNVEATDLRNSRFMN